MSTLMKKLNERVKTKRAAAAPYKGPDKTSANGNRPLTFPTPYHGGKRRWAEEILDAFGPERECVYVEPFSGSAAVLLANDKPYAREILCDTNPHISNVFRSLAWAPETTAFWADWPTTHQDLTARHTWLLRWAVDHVADIEADPDFHDPKAAGWWLWGKSNWIGSEFGIVKGLSVVEKEQIPYAQGPTGQGVQAQRATLPTAPEKIPHVKEITAGHGVSAQRHGDILYGGGKGYQPPTVPSPPPEKMPFTDPRGGGNGVQAQRMTLPTETDSRPHTMHSGRGVAVQRKSLPTAPDKRPLIGKGDSGGTGVQAQRSDDTLPQSSADISYAPEHGGGRGVNAQRKQAYPDSGGRDAVQLTVSDTVPQYGDHESGFGVSARRKNVPFADLPAAPAYGKAKPPHHPGHEFSGQRGDRPFIQSKGSGGNGVQTQRQPQDSGAPLPHYDGRAYKPDAAPVVARPTTPVPLTGDRLRPWFQALAERLYRVIILNRGWQSGLTPTVLQQTRTARKPPVRVLIDPPYKGVGKLYGMSEDEADALAVASWRWAAEHGSREGWRIAYACREGDFDDEALALGWTCSKMGIAANHSDTKQEVVWFSPHCLRGGRHTSDTASEVAQPTMFDMGEE